MGLLQSVCGLWDFSRQHPWSALATVLVVCVHVGCLLYHGSYMCICVLLLEVACVASFMYQLGGQRTCVEPMKAVANEAAVQLVAMRRQNEGLADEKEELAEEKKELAGEKEELAEEKEELVEEKEELVEEKQELEELINIADKKEPALQAGSPADLILRVLDQMLEGEAPREAELLMLRDFILSGSQHNAMYQPLDVLEDLHRMTMEPDVEEALCYQLLGVTRSSVDESPGMCTGGRTVAEPVSQPIHAPNLNLIHTLIRPYPHPCLTAWHTAPKKVGLEVDQGDAHDCTLSEETSTLPRRKAGAGQQDEGGEEDGLRDMLAAIAGDSSSLDPHRCLCNAIGSSVLVPKSRGPGSACSQEHAAQFEPGSEKLASEKSQRSLAGSAMQLRNTMRRASSNNTSISACLPQVAASGSPWLTSTQKNASGSSWSSFGAAGLFGFPSTASARGERGQGGRGSLPISPSQSLQERRSKLRTLSALKLEAGVSLPQRALRTRSSHNLGLAWQQAHQARQQAASAEAQQSHAEPPCVGAEHSQHSQGSLHAHRDHGTLASTLQPQASRRRSRPPRPSLSTSCLMPAGAKARSPLGRSAAAPEEDVPPTLQGRRSVGAVPVSKPQSDSRYESGWPALSFPRGSTDTMRSSQPFMLAGCSGPRHQHTHSGSSSRRQSQYSMSPKCVGEGKGVPSEETVRNNLMQAAQGSKHYALDEAERMAAQQLCSSGSSRARRPQTSESLTVGPRATPFADEPHHSDSLSWSSPFLNQEVQAPSQQPEQKPKGHAGMASAKRLSKSMPNVLGMLVHSEPGKELGMRAEQKKEEDEVEEGEQEDEEEVVQEKYLDMPSKSSSQMQPSGSRSLWRSKSGRKRDSQEHLQPLQQQQQRQQVPLAQQQLQQQQQQQQQASSSQQQLQQQAQSAQEEFVDASSRSLSGSGPSTAGTLGRSKSGRKQGSLDTEQEQQQQQQHEQELSMDNSFQVLSQPNPTAADALRRSKSAGGEGLHAKGEDGDASNKEAPRAPSSRETDQPGRVASARSSAEGDVISSPSRVLRNSSSGNNRGASAGSTASSIKRRSQHTEDGSAQSSSGKEGKRKSSKLASSACQLMHNLFEGPTRSRRKPKRVQTFSGKLPSTTEPLHLSPRRNPSGSSKSGGPMRKLLGGVKSLSRKALEGASTGSSSAAPAEPAPKPSARKQDAAWEVNQSRVGSLREVRKRILSVPPSPPTDPNLSLIDDEYKSGPVSDTESFHLGFFGGAEDRGLEEACSAETKYSRSAPNLVAEGADKAAAEAAAAASAQGFAPTEAAVEEQQKCIEEEEAQEEGECARQKELVKIREAAQKSEGGAVRIRKSSALSFEDTRSSTPMVDPGSSSATLPASIFPASARSSLAHPGRASKQSSSIPDLVSLSSSFPQMSESCNTCRSSGPAKSSIGLDESGPTSVTWMPSSDTPLPALRVHAQAAASKGIPRIEPSGYGQRRSASVPGVCLDDGGFCDSDRAASAATVEGVDEAGRRFGAVTSAAQQQQQQQQQQQVALGPKFLPVLEMERVLGAAYDSFSFDAFELAAVTQGHPLSALAYYLFHKTGLISGFSLHPTKLARFLRCIEAGYSPHTPYHNATHAADVVQTLHVLMHKGSMVPHCADGLSQLAALMAAVMHDYEHMGLTNDFLINSFSPLAIRYNDRAPLENHHLAAGFTVLHTPDFNFLTALPKPEYCRMRKMVIELVLATDMKQHFALVGQFKVVVRSLTHSRLKQHDPASSPRSSPFDRSTGHSQQQKSPMCRSVSTNLAPMLDPQSVNVKPENAHSSTPERSEASNLSLQRVPLDLVALSKLKAGTTQDVTAKNERGPRRRLSARTPSFNDPITRGDTHSSIDRATTGGCSSQGDLAAGDQSGVATLTRTSSREASLNGKTRASGEVLRSSNTSKGDPGSLDDTQKLLLLQIALKCADLGHIAEDHDVHVRWVHALEEEFYRQGDREKAAKLPVSPLFDRDKPGVTKSQAGFFDVVVLPLFQAFTAIMPGAKPFLEKAERNYQFWTAQKPEQPRS